MALHAETLLNFMMDRLPAILWTTDMEGRFMSIAGAALTDLNVQPAEIVGRTMSDMLHTESMEFQPIAATRHALAGEPATFEQEWTGRTYQMHIEPLRDRDGGIIGAIGVAFDTTRQKRAEEQLRQAEDMHRTVIETTPTATLVIEEDTTIALVNSEFEKALGYSREEIEGKKSWTELVFKDDVERLQSYHWIRRIDPHRAPRNYEARFKDRKGQIRNAHFTVAMIPGTTRSVVSVLDITERKHLEAQFLQAQKMESVGRLASGLTHDFNNLLTAIIGYATLARDALLPGDHIRGDIEQILKASERASNLSKRLLVFSRRQVAAPSVLNLNTLIVDMDKMLRRLIGEGIEIVTSPAPDLGLVAADLGQIEQALVNLVVNARDAMPNGGTMVIETANVTLPKGYFQGHIGTLSGKCVRLTIRDTGVGMTEEVKAHLFEPFFTTKEAGKGTGLGLVTVNSIVKQNHGDIRIDSEPGKGTAATIYLPQVEGVEEKPALPDEVSLLPGGDETILVAEDDATMRGYVIRALSALGYTILEANDGIEALRVAGRHEGEIHLLLTDVVMPHLSGKELADRLVAARPELKVLFVSGYTEVVHQDIIETGVPFLQKPFTAEILACHIRRMLDEQKQLVVLRSSNTR